TFNSLGIEQMTVSDGALREGVIQDLLGRIYDHDIRSATAQSLAERYHTDKQQAARIKKTIDYILNQLNNETCPFEIENSEQFLHWAAELHEIGHDIAHSQYHKHSAYIIENGDLGGFSKQDQILLSTIIRSHRRKCSLAWFCDLPAPWNTQAPYLTIILRLAVLLHRNRHEHDLPDFKIALVKGKIDLQFPAGWLNKSPLTRADLIQETDYLKSAGFTLTFS
ncbi:MAG: exopolyphosphatase, partial [Methylococcaceae bacterium]